MKAYNFVKTKNIFNSIIISQGVYINSQ